jgi:hypothetical protein
MRLIGYERTAWQTFRVPLLLAVLTMFGLLAALLAEGVWQVLSWLALATPIALALRHAMWPSDRRE